MKINNQEVNIDDLYNEKYMHKEIKKGIFLSEYQIDILIRNGINPNECSSINEIIYQINEILDEEDIEELDIVSKEITEFNYYTNTNK